MNRHLARLAIALVLLLAAWLWLPGLLAQDACLDRGGSWQAGRCIGAPISPGGSAPSDGR
ncbi:hypothetical protein [Pseudoroseomonas cervicalis]|uniref:hypothetical protein n=1 Tax=Teichococcus cervicalis TaxID=204525 RepID=UPI00278A05C6|nr:hypothetical protein [Pseudoroseomonas cervicalis]MDQ1078448.1 hypothetical protein [Pseudoroseomonas cervicalis]